MATATHLKKHLEDMDNCLRSMNFELSGCVDDGDRGKLGLLCWEHLKVISWQKVAPYIAEAFCFHADCDEDVSFVYIAQDAARLWFENQPKVARELVRQSYEGRNEGVGVEFEFCSDYP